VEDLLAEADLDLLVRPRGIARQQIAEGGLVTLADGSVEARHGARRVLHLDDLLDG
jgi:hypothetical protein